MTTEQRLISAWLLLHDTDRSTSPEPVMRLPRGIDFRDDVQRDLAVESLWRVRVRANEQRRNINGN